MYAWHDPVLDWTSFNTKYICKCQVLYILSKFTNELDFDRTGLLFVNYVFVILYGNIVRILGQKYKYLGNLHFGYKTLIMSV